MEPGGCSRWQSVANQICAETAKTNEGSPVRVRKRALQRLRNRGIVRASLGVSLGVAYVGPGAPAVGAGLGLLPMRAST